MFKEFGVFEFDPRQRDRFGRLWRKWAAQYPELFDEDDIRIATSQAGPNHFFEWLGAIAIYRETGSLSLVEKYECKVHKRKFEIFGKLASPKKVLSIKQRKPDGKRTQCPDLLVYAPDLSDWYFCEVKGLTDKVRETQERYFKTISRISKRPVYLLYFQPCESRPTPRMVDVPYARRL